MIDTSPRYVRVDARDNVGIVVNDGGLAGGSRFENGITLNEAIPQAHKLALQTIAKGEPVVRYAQPIGIALRDFRPGEYIRQEDIGALEPPPLDSLADCDGDARASRAS